MPFVEVGRKSVMKRDIFPDCVYVSNRWLKFSEDFWKTQLGSSPAVRLFFNEETNQVGLVPCQDHGYKILTRKGSAVSTVNWRSFVIKVKLDFAKFTYFKIEDTSTSMKTFCVVNNERRP